MSDNLSPRLERLRVELAGSIPCRTADRPALLAKRIMDVTIDYLTWKARMIRPQPRTVDMWPEVTNSPHYAALSGAIADITRELEAETDMNARLSSQVRTRGFAATPPADRNDTPDERKRKFWRGKYRARVVYDVHHLHMGPRRPDGTVGRTGELLFVGITGAGAYLLTIGDHQTFDDLTPRRVDGNAYRRDGCGAGRVSCRPCANAWRRPGR